MSDISIDQNNQAREAERAVLGGLMLETHRFDTVIQVITETDFQGKDHQIIFESMSELVNENKPLDPLTVSEKLDNSNNLNRVGGKNYLIEHNEDWVCIISSQYLINLNIGLSDVWTT